MKTEGIKKNIKKLEKNFYHKNYIKVIMIDYQVLTLQGNSLPHLSFVLLDLMLL